MAWFVKTKTNGGGGHSLNISFLFSFRLENEPKTHEMIADTEHRCSVVVLIFNSMDRRKARGVETRPPAFCPASQPPLIFTLTSTKAWVSGRTIVPSDYRAFGLLNLRIIEPSDYRYRINVTLGRFSPGQKVTWLHDWVTIVEKVDGPGRKSWNYPGGNLRHSTQFSYKGCSEWDQAGQSVYDFSADRRIGSGTQRQGSVDKKWMRWQPWWIKNLINYLCQRRLCFSLFCFCLSVCLSSYWTVYRFWWFFRVRGMAKRPSDYILVTYVIMAIVIILFIKIQLD